LDVAFVALIIAALSFVVVILMSLIEWKSLLTTLGIQRWLAHESEVAAMERENQPSIGDQIGDWLTAKESDEEDAPMMIDVLAARIGKMFFQSQRFTTMQEGSVEARHFNGVDEKVFEALKNNNPEVRIVARILEELGLGDLVNEKDLPYVMQKYGRTLGLGQRGVPSNDGVCR